VTSTAEVEDLFELCEYWTSAAEELGLRFESESGRLVWERIKK
jgi:hypothetical protein